MNDQADNSSELDDIQPRYCVVIPCYNHGGTLKKVIEGVLVYTRNIIAVNDGSTDQTGQVLEQFPGLEVIHHPVNMGKGMALRNAFTRAMDQGFDCAITMDADNQHYADDLPVFLEKTQSCPGAILVGARMLEDAGQPRKNSFANRLSNFWYRVETGVKLPDTQSGYRLYPLKPIRELNIRSDRYAYELEILVRASWKNIPVIPVPVKVYYPPAGERVSHFDPVSDFSSITRLNVKLVLLGILYYRPLKFFRHFSLKRLWEDMRSAFNVPGESNIRKAHSVALGIFFGIVPIWGYQLVSAIFMAYLLRLNKAIVVLTAQISIPPMIPFIVYLSIKTGEMVTGKQVNFSMDQLAVYDVFKMHLPVYITGACVLAVIAALLSWFLSYLLIRAFRTKQHPS